MKYEADTGALLNDNSDLWFITPGRFSNYLEECEALRNKLKTVEVLLLDEADVLVEMGMIEQIQKIANCVSPKRQSLFFSATLNKRLDDNIPNIVSKSAQKIVSLQSVVAEPTVAIVDQTYMEVSFEDQAPVLIALIRKEMQPSDAKVICFFCSRGVTGLFSQMLALLGVDSIFELHSSAKPARRANMSNGFRAATKGILLTTDITARGMDYPDVTCVIQFGIAANQKQYIHRLGRTARAGRTGRGITVVTAEEAPVFLSAIRKNLPVKQIQAPRVTKEQREEFRQVKEKLEHQKLTIGLQGFTGFYNSDFLPKTNPKWSQQKFVEFAMRWRKLFSPSSFTPVLSNMARGKMGLAKPCPLCFP